MTPYIGVLLLAGSAAMIDTAVAQESTHSRVREYGSVRMTYDELSQLLTRLNGLLPLDTQDLYLVSSNEVQVDDGLSSLQVANTFPPDAFVDAPRVARSLRYSFGARGAPITRVWMELNDFRRRITVTGESIEQVRAVSAFLAEEMARHETWFGGVGFRLFGGVALTIGLAVLSVMVVRKHPRLEQFVVVLPLLAWPVVIWVPPWERFFPGVAVFADSSSSLVRYGPEISFVGTVVGLISIALAIRFRPAGTQSQNDDHKDAA